MADSTQESATKEHVDGLIDFIAQSRPEVTPEPTEAPQVTPEPTKELRDDQGKFAKKDERKTVPYDALHEERQKRKELQRKLENEADERKRLESRFDEVLKTLKPQEELDPFTVQQNQINQINQKFSEDEQQKKQQADQEKKNSEFMTRYREAATEYAQDNPQFTEAYNHLIEARKKELSRLIKDPVRLQHALANDEKTIVEAAFENEENPAQVIYDLSVERGYKPKTEAKQDIKQIEKKIEASKSLGTGGGGGDSDASIDSLTAKDLAVMSDAEFNALVKKHAPRGFVN